MIVLSCQYSVIVEVYKDQFFCKKFASPCEFENTDGIN